MRGIGSADETVVLDAQLGPQRLIFGGNTIHEFLRGLARFGGSLDDLVAVLIRAREHAGIFAAHAVEALERVSHKGSIGMPEMRPGIDVINGRGDIKALHWPYS